VGLLQWNELLLLTYLSGRSKQDPDNDQQRCVDVGEVELGDVELRDVIRAECTAADVDSLATLRVFL